MRIGRRDRPVSYAARRTAVLLCTVLGVLLAGCGSPQVTTPPSPTPCVTATPAPSPQPAASEPTPIAQRGWSTYTNQTYHYSLQYPSNWFLPPISPSNFYAFNFDPSQFAGADRPPPPYNEIEVDALPNPSQQSLTDFYASNRNSPTGPPPCSVATQQLTVARHPALEVVQTPTANAGPGAITYPTVTVYVADGTTILALYEFYSPGGRPSPVFAHMLASLAIAA
jgi:hypothetical protein